VCNARADIYTSQETNNIHTYIHTYTHMHTHTYIYIYIHIHIHTHTHTHTHTDFVLEVGPFLRVQRQRSSQRCDWEALALLLYVLSYYYYIRINIILYF